MKRASINTELQLQAVYKQWLEDDGLVDNAANRAQFDREVAEQRAERQKKAATEVLDEMVAEGRAEIVGKDSTGANVYRKI